MFVMFSLVSALHSARLLLSSLATVIFEIKLMISLAVFKAILVISYSSNTVRSNINLLCTVTSFLVITF